MSLLLFYILLAPTTCTPFPHLFKRPAGLSLYKWTSQLKAYFWSILLTFFILFNVFFFKVEGDGSLPEVMKNYFRDNFWWRVHKTVVGLQIWNGGEGGEDANDSLSSLEVVPLCFFCCCAATKSLIAGGSSRCVKDPCEQRGIYPCWWRLESVSLSLTSLRYITNLNSPLCIFFISFPPSFVIIIKCGFPPSP